MAKKRPVPPPSTGEGGDSGPIILNKYQLGHLLGCGSFAKVYHARRLDDCMNFAIKIIDKKTSTMNDNMERLIMREVSAMHRLNNHPNIIKLIEVMATKSKIYLVMELAPGDDLLSKLNRGGRFSSSG